MDRAHRPRLTALAIALAAVALAPANMSAADEPPSPLASAPSEAAMLSASDLRSLVAAVALADGEATVVADVTITRDLPRRALRCGLAGFPRPERCPVGVIMPSEPGEGLLPVVAGDEVMAALPDDASPIEGLLGFRLHRDELELLGALDTEAVTAALDGQLERVEGAGPPTLSTTEDGLVLEVWLSDTSVDVGGRLKGLVRVSNTGMSSPRWETNVCGAGPAPTTIQPTLPDAGTAWTGKAATFKRKLLSQAWGPQSVYDIDMVGRDDVGCTAWSQVEPFVPGSVSQMVVAWDAVDREGRPMLPGPATLTATFETVTQPRRGPYRRHEALAASTTVEVVGEPGTTTPVSVYADVALSDDVFRTWLERQRGVRHWRPYANFWFSTDGEFPHMPRFDTATEGAVDIGFEMAPYGRITIDTATLEILGRRLPR